MKNINIEEVKRYLKRSLKKKVKITTSLIVLFMMSNSIVSGNVIMIENGKISASTKPKLQSIPNQKKKTVALNPNSEAGNTVGIDNVAEGSVAVGYLAKSSGGSSVAVGYGAEAIADESVAIGHNAITKNRESVSMGFNSKVIGDQGVSIGANTGVTRQSVAIGSDIYALGESSIAIGNDDIGGTDYLPEATIRRIYKGIVEKDVKKQGEFDSAYINSKQYSPTYAGGKSAIAIGSRSVASADQSIAMGVLSFALAEGSTAIGRYAFVDENASQGLAVGEKARVFSAHSLALGSENESTSEGSMSYGYKAKAVGAGSLAIGNMVASNADIKNISELQNIFTKNDTQEKKKEKIKGYTPTYSEKNDVKFTLSGKEVKPLQSKGEYGLTLGSNAYSIGNNSMTIGSLSLSEGKNSLALGVISYAKGDNSMAIGTESISQANNSMAIGIGAKANLENSLALGNKSITDYQKDWFKEKGYVPKGAISLPSSTNVGVISVGSIGQERRITNVAAGYRDTDAVNVSQLKSVEDKLSAVNLSGYDSSMVNFVSVDKTTADGEGKKMQDLAIRMGNYKEYIQLKSKLLEMKVRREKNHEDINGEVEKEIEKLLKDKKYNDIKNKDKSFKEFETQVTNSKEPVTKILTEIDKKKDELIKEENLKSILNDKEKEDFEKSNFYNKSTTGKDAVAIGAFADATKEQAVAIGKNAKGDSFSVAIGGDSESGNTAVAIGHGAKANHNDSVAIGNGSEAKSSTTKAYLTDDTNNGGRTFAVGSTSIKRRITSVADGSADSDAVTVAQLKKLSEKGITFKDDNDTKTTVGLAGEIKISGKEENNHRNISVTTNNKNLEVTLSKTLKGITSIENDNNSAKLTLNENDITVNNKKLTGLADGSNDSDAVTYGQVKNPFKVIADNNANGVDQALGKKLEITGRKVTNNVISSAAWSVSGNNNPKNGRYTTENVETFVSSSGEGTKVLVGLREDPTFKKITLKDGGTKQVELTPIVGGLSLNNKKIIGLADGVIDSNSTDAVTGKQLEARTKFTIQADMYREGKTDNSNKPIELPFPKKIIFRGASKSEEIEVNGKNGKEKKSVPKTYDTTYATENVRTYIEKNGNDYEVIVAFKNKPKFDKVQIGEVGGFVISKNSEAFEFNKKKLGNVAPGRIGNQSGDVVVGDQLKDYVKQIVSSNDGDISVTSADIMESNNKVGVKYTLGLKQDLKDKINKIDDKADKSELTKLENKEITFIGDTRGAETKDVKVKLGEEIQIKAEDRWNFNKQNNSFDKNQDNYETENLSTYYRIKDGKKQILIGMKDKPRFEEVTIGKSTENRISITKDGISITKKVQVEGNNNNPIDKSVKIKVDDNGSLKLDSKKLTGLADGTDSTDAVNKKQLDEKASATELNTLKRTVTTNTSSINTNKEEIAKKLNKDDLSIEGDTYISVGGTDKKYKLTFNKSELEKNIDLSKNTTIGTINENLNKKANSDATNITDTIWREKLNVYSKTETNNEIKKVKVVGTNDEIDVSPNDKTFTVSLSKTMKDKIDAKANTSDLEAYAKKDASNITESEWVTKLGDNSLENGNKLAKSKAVKEYVDKINIGLENKGLKFNADQGGEQTQKLGSSIKIASATGEISDKNIKYLGKNIKTKITKDGDNSTISLAFSDSPEFSSVKIGDSEIKQTTDENNKNITINGDTVITTKNILSQTIGYKANNGTAKKVSLENGFTFENTDNITSKAEDEGKISFELNKDLKKISSIESDGTEEAKKTKVTLTENGTEFKTGTDGVTTKIGKDGIEITKGSKTVSITTTDKGGSITGLEDRKVSNSNYGEAGRVATEGAVKEIYDQLNSNNGVSNKLNEVRNGLAGTVIYTDKDGNKLVKLKDGKYYNSDYVDEKGNLKVGHTYDKGLESHNIFATVVNPDGSTKEPTTKLRIADGSISAGSKEAVTGGQLHTELAKKLDEATYETDKKTFATKKELENSNVEVAGTTGEIIVTPETKADGKGTKYTVKLENTLKTKIDGALQSSTAESTYAKIDGSNLSALTDDKKKAWATGIGLSSISDTTKDQLVTDKAVKEYLTTEIGKVNNNIENKTIAYKANNGASKTTSLTTGFNFTSDDLEIKTENDGKVTFNLTDKVKNSLNGKDNDGRDGKSGYNSAGSKGLTGKDGLNGKDLTTKVNALRNGEAGTVVYTDKDGNRLVKANNGKYYNSEYVDDKGNLKVGHTYDKGLESYNIFATLVNSDGTTDKPTTKLRVADGSITKDSKEAINGGQVYNKLKEYALKDASNIDVTNWVTKLGDDNLENGNNLAKSKAVKEYVDKIKNGLEDKGLKFNADQGGEQTQKLGSSIKVASATEEISENNTNYLGKNIKTKIAKDGDNSTISLAFSDSPEFSSVKIGDKGKTVSITTTDKGGSITGLEERKVSNSNYGEAGRVATEGAVKEIYDQLNSNNGISNKLNELRNGLAGTVIYTDKDGNKLVKLKGKFYKQSELKNGELPVGHSYDDGLDAKDIFLSTVNPDGSTTTPTTKLRIADGSIAKDSKEAVTGGQVYEIKNKVDTLTRDNYINFAGDSGNDIKISLAEKLSIVGEGDTTLAETAKNNITVQSEDNKLTVKLAKNLQNMKSFETEAKDGNKTTLNQDGLKIGNDTKAVKITNESITGLKDTSVDNTKYGQSGVVATQKEVKAVLNKVHSNEIEQKKIKDGLAGTIIYTDKDGNKLVKVNGAYYKQSDVKDDGNIKDNAISISSDNIKVTLVGADGSIDKGVTLGNLKSTLGLNKANNGMTEINKKSILSKLTGNENYSEKELDNAVSLRDLQFVAKTGLVFSGNSGSVIKPIGETVRIIGGAKLSEKILEDTSSVIDPKAKYSDNGKEDFEKNFTSSSIATRVNEEGNIQIGISKDIKDIRTIEFAKGENEKAIGKIKGLANGEISSTSNDAINGAQLNDILDKVGIKVNDDKTGFNTLEIKEIEGKKPSNILEGLNKTIESINEQSVGYKVNNGKVETVKLKEGFNFVNGTNTTASVEKDGKIKYSLNKELKGIEGLELKKKDKKLSLAVNNKGEAVIKREESIQSTEKVITTDDKLKLKFKSSTASDKNERVINIAKNEALDFKAGSNLTSKVSDGSIEYGLKSDLKGITSISSENDKSKIELTDSGLKLTNDNATLSIEKDGDNFKLSGLKDSDVNNGYGKSGVAATQKEVKNVLDKVNKNIKGQNDLKDGLAGTVIYTDKDGNKLVKLKDGKYYNSDYVDEKGNLKVGHTYDKGLESHNIFATVVNPDGSTTTPTTKLRIADGSISAGSKEAVTGGQVYELKNKIEDISKKQFIKFKGDTNDEQTLNLGDTLEVVGEGDITPAETAKNNITVQADKNKLTVKLAKKLQNMKSFETEAKDGNKTTLNQDGLKIGNDTKAVKITNESITGLTERKVSGSDYGEKGRAATEGAVKEVYDKLNTLNQGLTFKANKGQTKKEIGKILGVLGGATLKEKLIEDRSSIIDPKAKSSDNGKEDFDTNYNSKNVATRVSEDNNIHIGVSKELKDMRSFETEKDGEGNSSKLNQKELSIIGKDGDSINISNNEIKFGKNGGTISGLKGGKIEAGSTDAVSGGQVYEKLKTMDSHLNTNYYNKSKINEMIGEVDKKSTVALEKSELALGGVANAVAMANLVQVNSYSRHRHNLSAAYGYYGGSHALAVGFSGTNEERNFVYKLSGSVNNKGNLAFGVGAGVMLGEENENNYPEKVKKVSELENKVKKQEEEINKLKKQAEKTDMLEKQVAELMKLIKKKK